MSALHDGPSPQPGLSPAERDSEGSEPWGDLHAPPAAFRKSRPPEALASPALRPGWWITGLAGSAAWLSAGWLTQNLPDLDDWERTGMLAVAMTIVGALLTLAVGGEAGTAPPAQHRADGDARCRGC
jgi:hypothetical protein